MKYKLFVFDWDGTLMDSQVHIVDSFQSTIRDLSLPTKENDEVKNIIGLGMGNALEMLFPGTDDVFYKQFVACYRDHYLLDRQSRSALFPGTVEVLQRLTEQQCFLAVATGKGKAGLKDALADTGVGHYFHSTRCAEETVSKPHPLMLLEIMDELAMRPDETLMIGDTEYDLEMATNAGVASLAVSTGVHERERLLSHNPVGCIAHIGEMLAWLHTSFSK